MVNQEKLHNDLIEMFIEYQYRLENPMLVIGETKRLMVLRYRENYQFHAKVDALACGAMAIVVDHLNQGE